jgi:hypothetical protein
MATDDLENSMKLSAVVAIALSAACAAKLQDVDPCARTGTCVALQLSDSQKSLGVVDSIEIALNGAEIRQDAVVPSSGATNLPIAVAILTGVLS